MLSSRQAVGNVVPAREDDVKKIDLKKFKKRPPIQRSDVQAVVLDIIVEMTGIDPERLTVDMRLREDLGLDDLDYVELIMAFEETFGVEIPDDVSERLRVFGWIVPAYPMPTGMEDTHVLRIVVRNGFTRDMAELLVRDLKRVVARLCQAGGDAVDVAGRKGFHH
jgi:acyl carrier protein